MAEIKILYFASLGEKLNSDEEVLTLDDDGMTVGELKDSLSERGGNWRSAMSQASLRCAVDQTIVEDEHLISAGAEVAFFPPVTGG